MTDLRYYQEDAIEEIYNSFKDEQRVLLVMATGTGKTVVFSRLIEEFVSAGGRVLVLAHREELLLQAQNKLADLGVVSSIEKGIKHADKESSVVIASVQSLSNLKRLKKWDPKYFHLIVVDEAHHSAADTYIRILNYFVTARVLGVTATPNRSDKKDLTKIYTKIAYEYGLKQAIEDHFLSNINVKVIPLELDISDVSVTAGDFQVDELADALVPYLNPIADAMAIECQGKKTIVFLPLVKISQEFQQILENRGFRVGEINAKTPNRAQVLKDFHEGKYDVIVNAMLLTEGFDEPSVDCIVVLRPTKSFSLYSQMVGRGTRLADGKSNLLLLDFMWLSQKHDLCRPAHLITPNAKETLKKSADVVK